MDAFVDRIDYSGVRNATGRTRGALTGSPTMATLESKEPVHQPDARARAGLESFTYDDGVVRLFAWATVIWGIVAFLVGVVIAIQLAFPAANLGLSFTSFGRLRPLHTNAAIFAFAGNAIFAGDLLLNAEVVQGADVQRPAQPTSTSGAGRRLSSRPP
jgi:hypothetical protein